MKVCVNPKLQRANAIRYPKCSAIKGKMGQCNVAGHRFDEVSPGISLKGMETINLFVK